MHFSCSVENSYFNRKRISAALAVSKNGFIDRANDLLDVWPVE
jgi:hypothetical protein